MTFEQLEELDSEAAGALYDTLEEFETNADESLSRDPPTLSALVEERIADGLIDVGPNGQITFSEGPLNNPHNSCARLVWANCEWQQE